MVGAACGHTPSAQRCLFFLSEVFVRGVRRGALTLLTWSGTEGGRSTEYVTVATSYNYRCPPRKSGTVTIHTGSGFGDCGYEFAEGSEYLIYAYGPASKLQTSVCTRTRLLRDTGEEILELQAKLPKIPTPPRPPQLMLKGKIDDAGYRGYVFEFQNHLHERIFYDLFQTQIFRDGKWEDYPSNQGVEPPPELSPEAAAEMLRQERAESAQVETPLGTLRKPSAAAG
jgi:hypothetical protein